MSRMHDTPPRKICFVVERLADRRGGAERVVADLANGLAARGHDVAIVHHEPVGGTIAYPVSASVRVENIWRRRRALPTQADRFWQRARNRLVSRSPQARWNARYMPFGRALTLFAEDFRPDVMIGVMPPAMGGMEMADLPAGTLRVASTHNAPEQEYRNPERWDKGEYGMKRRLTMLDAFDRIGVLLPEYREWYAPTLRTRIWVTPNMIHETPVTERAEPRRSRTVVAVGRLAPAKRIALLVKAWAKVHQDFPDWRLEVHGDGPLRAEIETTLEQEGLPLSILKGVTTDMSRVYRRAAFLAHASYHEGFPLAVGEALSSGLPVLGFRNCSGLNSMIRDEENGLLVGDEGDPVCCLAEGLARLMEDSDLRGRLGSAAPASMLPYSEDQVLDIWESFLFETGPVKS